MSDQNINLAEALARVMDSRLADVNTALPGEVTRYDRAAGVVDVRPMIRRAVPDVAGETVLEDLPVIPSVPVLWPSGGGCSLTLPLAVGDHVQILFNQRDLDHYRSSGGRLADPGVLSTLGLSGAVAIPCSIRGAVDADASHVLINLAGSSEVHVGGDSDAVALDSGVQAELVKIKSALDAVSNGGGALTGANTYTLIGSTDSAKLKVSG